MEQSLYCYSAFRYMSPPRSHPNLGLAICLAPSLLLAVRSVFSRLFLQGENEKSQHYKMNYPRQVVAVLNRESSVYSVGVSLFYLSMSVPSSPLRLISRHKSTYKISIYQIFCR